MKKDTFKSVSFNNRKKQLIFIYGDERKITVHFGKLNIDQNIKKAWIDEETGFKSVGLEFEDGNIDYIPYDQPLSISGDPDFVLRNHIELITAHINKELAKQGISKHYLAESLNTSDNQIQRLLNPSLLNKNLKQLYTILDILGLRLELKLKTAA